MGKTKQRSLQKFWFCVLVFKNNNNWEWVRVLFCFINVFFLFDCQTSDVNEELSEIVMAMFDITTQTLLVIDETQRLQIGVSGVT